MLAHGISPTAKHKRDTPRLEAAHARVRVRTRPCAPADPGRRVLCCVGLEHVEAGVWQRCAVCAARGVAGVAAGWWDGVWAIPLCGPHTS
eukprot:19728-Chlamydomonas_euryale.AAC.1